LLVLCQGEAKIAGSTGAIPSATDTMANPIKAIEAHAPKARSEGFRRSCTRYRVAWVTSAIDASVNRAMSISNFLRDL
jgi:hypothetical protein